MTRSASALPDDIGMLKAMLVAMAVEKAELQAEAGQLKTETAELKAVVIRLGTVNERAEERIADLHAIIKQLERARFGRSSEKIDADQQAFAFDEVQTGLGAIEAELEVAKPAGERQRAARPRKAFPAHLERVEIVIDPETITPCACGNYQAVRIAEDAYWR